MKLHFKDYPIIFNLDILDIIFIVLYMLTLYYSYLNYFETIDLNNKIYVQINHINAMKKIEENNFS